MEICNVKKLSSEHDMLSKTVRLINEAAEKNNWVAIKTPSGEGYLSNMQIRSVMEIAEKRINDIEKIFSEVSSY